MSRIERKYRRQNKRWRQWADRLAESGAMWAELGNRYGHELPAPVYVPAQEADEQ